jgi:hypothetical protein
MAFTRQDASTTLKQSIDELRTLRDEIRVQLHLASLDVRERWERDLEPRFYGLEAKMHDASDTTRELAQTLTRDFRRLRDSLRSKAPH